MKKEKKNKSPLEIAKSSLPLWKKVTLTQQTREILNPGIWDYIHGFNLTQRKTKLG